MRLRGLNGKQDIKEDFPNHRYTVLRFGSDRGSDLFETEPITIHVLFRKYFGSDTLTKEWTTC